MKRVVITGLGAVSPLGGDVDALLAGLRAGRSAVRRMESWKEYSGLRSLVAAPAELRNAHDIPRQSRRSMGRMSIFAVQATNQALSDSGLEPDRVADGRTGCVIGSTMGGPEALNETFETMLPSKDLSLLTSMKFFQCVSHTAAMNVAQYLGIKGCVLATSSACASSLQAIGVGYDLIRLGRQDAVLCGGSEEVHPTVTGSFDILYATSTHYNDSPEQTPRPFDRARDGLVCGEGSGIVLLEDLDVARARGARIYAEIVGFDTRGSGRHVSQSNADAILDCMRGALSDARVTAAEVDYVSAHATATIQGDLAEADAIRALLGDRVPVSSLKGYIGHTLGASGAIELIASLRMMADGVIYPTLNLEEVDEKCLGVRHVTECIETPLNVVMKNCFAFGGINASLVCRKVPLQS